MRNERRRSLIDKRKSCDILIVSMWKLKYQKFIKNVDFSIRKIFIVHVSIVFIHFPSKSQTHRFMIFFQWKLQKLLFVWCRNHKISQKINCNTFIVYTITVCFYEGFEKIVEYVMVFNNFNEILEKPKTMWKTHRSENSPI